MKALKTEMNSRLSLNKTLSLETEDFTERIYFKKYRHQEKWDHEQVVYSLACDEIGPILSSNIKV